MDIQQLTDCRLHSKWTPLVLYLLRDGETHRYSVLKRSIGEISQKMLTQTLRRLEEESVVERLVGQEKPPIVAYRLTDLGKQMVEPYLSLYGSLVGDGKESTSASTK